MSTPEAGEVVTLYSFGDNDRSGKVRWVAAELGLEVDEQRLELGAHRAPPYSALNPLKQVPTALYRGETLVESTAICQTIAESRDTPKLWIGPREPGRTQYLYWLAAFGETVEGRLVESLLSRAGVIGPGYFPLHEKFLRFKLSVLAKQLPAEGYLCGETFTVADVLAGYSLRLAVMCELVERASVEPYLGRLRSRAAAQTSRIFASLQD